MRVLGISAFYHDSAAALLVDGNIVAAAQEERFSRKKHDSRFPRNAIAFCLSRGGLTFDQIDYIAFYDKPFLKFERLLETYLAFAPRGFRSFRHAIPVWLREKLFQKSLLTNELKSIGAPVDVGQRLLFSEHHLSHAASAFFPSPFHKALVLTMDGVGEWATTSVAVGLGNELTVHREIHFPHSLGLLYSAFTYYTGFKVNSGEYKVMGLAPYGTPRFAQLILDNLIDLKPDGTFRLDQSFFDYCTGLEMTNGRFAKLFGQPPRKADEPLSQFHMDIAASIQRVTEEAIIRMTRALAKEFAIENLCLAGGVALNCVANGQVLRDAAFKRLWIQPAAGDAGGALGAALAVHHLHVRAERPAANGVQDAMQGSYLGPEFEQADIEGRLRGAGARFEVLDNDGLIDVVARALAEGNVVGWFQGRMEFGPRALGARSILADPRSPEMQRRLNLKIKFREGFRPFAPSVLREDVAQWFELEEDSPYMLVVANVHGRHCRHMTAEERSLFGIDKLNVVRSSIPAVTHVDYSARIQTVHKETNARYHRLLSRFRELTGCSVLANTSFNIRGEPIVCRPEDAFRCFMGTDMEMLAIGNCLLRKGGQDQRLRHDYRRTFEPD